jgi:hypothetical protein
MEKERLWEVLLGETERNLVGLEFIIARKKNLIFTNWRHH